MSPFLLNIKFYIKICLYTTYYLIIYFIKNIFYKNTIHENVKNKIDMPPRCLSNESNIMHKYTKLNHCKYHYVESGNKNNKLIILLHGYPEFWYSWRYQLKNLSTYYHIVALDMKGCGDTDKPMSINEYNINIIINELNQFILSFGKEQCSLITHGLGGLYGWYFINEYPDLIENYISISSPHPLSFLQELKQGRVNYEGLYYFTFINYYPEVKAMGNGLKIFDKIYSKMINNKRGNMTRDDINAYKYTYSRLDDWIGPINQIRILLLKQYKYKKNIKKSKIPTLFIIGNQDPYINLELICKSTEYVDNFTIKIVEGGGHFLPQEMPNYINSLIIDFMKIPEQQYESGDEYSDGSILRKMIGAGKTVWSTSKDAMTRGIPKKFANQTFLTLD